jgi:hypothetical protein
MIMTKTSIEIQHQTCACVIGDDDDDDGHYTPLKVCRYRGYTTHVLGMCVDEGWLNNERSTIIFDVVVACLLNDLV